MALQIAAACVNCFACEALCPNRAIAAARPHFLIDAKKCNECAGAYDYPQCVEICPIEGAIVDDSGRALNPPGSLSGIPPVRWAAAPAESAAREESSWPRHA